MFLFILLLLGSTHGFYLSYAIFKKNNVVNNANLLLALFVFSFSLQIFLILLNITELEKSLPLLIEADAPLEFILAPLLYIYIKKLTATAFYSVKLKHFLPALLVFLVSIPFYLQNGSFKQEFLNNFELLSPFAYWYVIIFEQIFAFLFAIQVPFYLYKIYQRLMHHRNVVNNNFSDTEQINLNWLIRLTTGVAVLFVFWLFDEVYSINADSCIDYGKGLFCESPWVTEPRLFYFSEMGVVLCIYLISIYGLKQPQIFSAHSRIYEQIEPLDKTTETNINLENTTKIKEHKYQKSSLTEGLSQSLFQELCNFINEQQLHLNNELSLAQLSEHSGWSKHHLSQAINQCAHKNFFDFINELRIEHAKSLLNSQGKMNVLEVSLAAGFNSRSAFYNAFKKHTQMTPSQYKIHDE